MTNEQLARITDIQIDGVDGNDYPDFCDAYVSGGKIDGRELTEDELEDIADNHQEWESQAVQDNIY